MDNEAILNRYFENHPQTKFILQHYSSEVLQIMALTQHLSGQQSLELRLKYVSDEITKLETISRNPLNWLTVRRKIRNLAKSFL